MISEKPNEDKDLLEQWYAHFIGDIKLKEGIEVRTFDTNPENSDALKGLKLEHVPISNADLYTLGLQRYTEWNLKMTIIFPYTDTPRLLNDLRGLIDENYSGREAINYLAQDLLLRPEGTLTINSKPGKLLKESVQENGDKEILVILSHGGFGGESKLKRILELTKSYVNPEEEGVTGQIEVMPFLTEHPDIVNLDDYSIVLDASCTFIDYGVRTWNSPTPYIAAVDQVGGSGHTRGVIIVHNGEQKKIILHNH